MITISNKIPDGRRSKLYIIFATYVQPTCIANSITNVIFRGD